MKHILYPDLYVSSVHAIDLVQLKNTGIQGLILDIDNTMVPYFVKEPTEDIAEWLKMLEAAGFRLFIVSNGKKERVEYFTRNIPIPYYAGAGKPGSKGFLAALQSMRLDAKETAVIGDQIFTDVWGGNRLSMTTILVKQVSSKDEWITAVKRPLEKIVLFFYKRYLHKSKTEWRGYEDG